MESSDFSPTRSRPAGPSRPRLKWLVVLILLPLAGAVAGLVVAVVMSYVMPRSYESVALVQIHPRMTSGNLAPELQAQTGAATNRENFVRTQMEVIRARETLGRVVDRLDLTARWGGMARDEAVDLLAENIKPELLEGTDLVRIRVRHSNAQDARDLAEAAVEAYRQRRVDLELQGARRALDALQSEVRDQEDLVEEKRKIFHTIVQAMRLPYFEGSEEGDAPGYAEGELLKAAMGELAALEAEKERAEVEMKAVTRLQGEALLNYITQRTDAPELEVARREARDKGAELEQRRTQFSEDHPEIRRLRREYEAHLEGLRQRGEAYRGALKVELEVLAERIVKMKTAVARQRDKAVDRALESQDYLEAKREYEAAQTMLEGMKEEHGRRRVAQKIPLTPITIHEKPLIARQPSDPKVGRICLGGILRGGLVGFLIAVPVAGLMMVRGRRG